MKKDLTKYALGRIHSKYLILEIISYAMDFEASVKYISSACTKYRKLIIRNHKAFMN